MLPHPTQLKIRDVPIFLNLQNLVGSHILQNLNLAAGPEYFDLVDLRHVPQSKVHAVSARGGVADARSHEIALASNPDPSPNAVPVASGSNQLDKKPMIIVRADVFPEFHRLSERRDDDVHSTIAVKVGKGASPMSSSNLETASDLPGYVPKFSGSHVGKNTVGLFVLGCFEKFDSVIYM